jgi:hypothetical protein
MKEYLQSIRGITVQIEWREQELRRHINTIVSDKPYVWWPVKRKTYAEICTYCLKLHSDIMKLRVIRMQLHIIVRMKRNRFLN